MNNPKLNSSTVGENPTSIDGKPRSNIVTARGSKILTQLPSVKRSQNMVEANAASLRLYKRACRLLPFILRIWQGWAGERVSLANAKANLAEHFRAKNHLRDPLAVDAYVQLGYQVLHNAEHKYSDYYHFARYLQPGATASGDQGISYLDKVKYEGKSSFLTKFYKGDRPNY